MNLLCRRSFPGDWLPRLQYLRLRSTGRLSRFQTLQERRAQGISAHSCSVS